MYQVIYPSVVDGIVHAPPSKSMTQRAIAAALLAEGQSVILNPSYCKDALAAVRVARNLGAEADILEDRIVLKGGQVSNSSEVNCGESGLTMRLFAPIAALSPYEFVFTGEGSLNNRPVEMIGEAIEKLKGQFNALDGKPPFKIQGPISGGQIRIDGSLSSQLLSGLLMALPVTANSSELIVDNLKSRPYIDMTLQVLTRFGIRVENEGYSRFLIQGNQKYLPCEFLVEGDWSAAAFLLVAGAIAGDIGIKGLDVGSCQADIAILEALKKAGAIIAISGSTLMVSSTGLNSFVFDATDCPDLFPPLAALAAYCNGTSIIRGIGRLVNKESNRAESISSVLEETGIPTELLNDELYIYGGRPRKAIVSSFGDHRITMMAAILALGATGPLTLEGAECVEKSFPAFFETIKMAGAHIETKHN